MDMDAPVARMVITPGALFRLLAKRFAERRSADCRACRVPLPYLVARPGQGLANWRIGTPGACAHGCDQVIAQVADELLAIYDLDDPGELITPDPEAQAR